MKNPYENVTTPVPAEKNPKRGEKRETREKVRDKEKLVTELIEEHLIVKDGYKWDSLEPPEVLPTMFHGTSEYFLENILQNGLKPEMIDLEAIEKEDTKIADALRNEIKEHQRNQVSITTRYNTALHHANKTPERYLNVASHEFVTYKGDNPHKQEKLKMWGRWDLEDFPRNSEIRRLFLSVFNPRGVILSLRPHKEDIDPELIKRYDPKTKFFLDAEYKKKFLENIKEMRSWLVQYVEEKRRNKGNTTFTIEEISKMHTVLGGKVLGMFRNRQEVEAFTPGEIAEIFFRDNLYEIPMQEISPDKITGVQRVKIPKPKENEKIAESAKTAKEE